MLERHDLKKLIEVGKKQQEVDLHGCKVQVRLLTVGEDIDAMKSCVGLDPFSREKELKVQILARAIMINGQPFPDLEEGCNFFREVQEPILISFAELYNSLRQLQLIELSNVQREK